MHKDELGMDSRHVLSAGAYSYKCVSRIFSVLLWLKCRVHGGDSWELRVCGPTSEGP